MASQVFGMIILCLIGLFVLYLVIYTAVKDGINKSLVGQYFERTQETKENKTSLLEGDGDN